MTDAPQPYNPLDRVELGKSVERALLARPLEELASYLQRRPTKYSGAGLYALYYIGSLSYYAPIAPPAQSTGESPIYVGRARPAGARQGALGLASTTNEPRLYDRLREHARSIDAAGRHSEESGAKGLAVSDFLCRHLVADDIWVPMGEALLIGHYRPAWNVVVDGFGNHSVGGGREKQARSSWDILHPGRTWAFRLKPSKSAGEIVASIVRHFKTVDRPDLDASPVLDEAVMRALAEGDDTT